MTTQQQRRADNERRADVQRRCPKLSWQATQDVVLRLASRLPAQDARALQMAVADSPTRDMSEALLWCERTGHLDLLRAVWPECP